MSTPPSSVVYVALGGRRIRAARHYSADLAAAGASVVLVVAARPEWAQADLGPGVTVHRVGDASGKTRTLLRDARKLLLDRNGPVAGAELVIAGDPEAMPVIDAVRRRFPSLTIRTEPNAEPGRRTAPADVAVVTPWYPSPNDPFAGAFVQATTDAVGDSVGRVTTLHTENWFYSDKGVAGKLSGVALDRRLEDSGDGVVVLDTPEGELTRVVAPQMTSGNYVKWARSQTERLEEALPTGRIEAPLIHAHTGHYGGVVAAALAAPDARLVVTEHITFLAEVFAHPGARKSYGEMLARASRVLCVGRSLYTQIEDRFPQYVDKLRIIPNPVDFGRFAVRPEPPKEPLRWLYIGRMLPHKGVRTLIDAFAQIAADEPRATLTLVGSGAMEGELRTRIAQLGLGDRITQRPPVQPDQVAALMHEHDVLVHASTKETFGMTVVEAVATGTPVLVARSDGPAETLHGLEGVAGATFEVTEDPAVIATAWRKLRDEWAGLDLTAARERLRARYSREAVGEQIREVYRQVLTEPVRSGETEVGAPLSPPPDPEAERITLIAIDSPHKGHTRAFIDTARSRGYAIDLVALSAKHWSRYIDDAGVRIYDIGTPEERRLPRRMVEGVTTSFPRWALGFARARSHTLPSPLPEAVARHGQQVHRVLVDAFNRRLYGKYYQVVRPRILWRLTKRTVLPELDLARTQRVVVHGVPGVTAGWGVARRNKAMPVGTDVTPPHEDARVVHTS